MSATLWDEIRYARAGGSGAMLDFYFLICTLRMGSADETGWHLWIFLLDLDQLAFFFYMLLSPFTWTFQIRAGSVSAGGRRLELDCSVSHTG